MILRPSLFFPFLVLGVLFGCENSNEESPVTQKIDQEDDVKAEETEVSVSIKPSDIFIDFVLEIESQNWVFDTARVNKVGLYSLDDVSVQSFENRPFYDLQYEQTLVWMALRYSPSDEIAKVSRTFSQADQIWGYFYRDKDGEGMISDGVIEQWIYPDSFKANDAFEYFEKHGNNIFFNTMPFFHQEGESIYIFHARAMAFSYDQKPLFEEFKKRFPKNNSSK